MKVVKVVDAIMGSGKSTQVISTLPQNKPFIYVTPLKSEITDRVMVLRPELRIHQPEALYGDGEYSKLYGLLELLKSGQNIATTHQLLKLTHQEHWDLLKKNGYDLYIDEEVDLITAYDGIGNGDVRWLVDNGILKVDSDGMVSFCDRSNEYEMTYREFKDDCARGLVYSVDESGSMLTYQIPPTILESCQDVTLMTYMFDGSVLKSFLSMKGFSFVDVTDTYIKNKSKPSDYKHLINFAPENYTDSAYDSEMSLSQNAWLRNKRALSTSVAGVIHRYARYCGAKQVDVLFTCPKSCVIENGKRASLRPKWYIHNPELSVESHTWLYSKARATNLYSHKTCLIHAVNVYPSIPVVRFMTNKGYVVDQDKYAISQLVQWLWRSAIRNGDSINVLVLSKRMRKLLIRWLNDEFENS